MEARFETYAIAHEEACLRIFDANCPRFFAPNERNEYLAFLRSEPEQYSVCVAEDRVVGAFGLIGHTSAVRLNWIMLDPEFQGRGLGSAILRAVREEASKRRAQTIEIAASHLSAPFFSRAGATEVSRTDNGWGPGMHRVDMIWIVEDGPAAPGGDS